MLVTVGMGRFPFDRLLTAVGPLCARRRVFAQTGPSAVALPCASAPFLPADELGELLEAVPVVITHAGNTVRLVQNLGKVPIAVPRRAEFGEMADDHQVAYAAHEREHGRIIVVEPEADALLDAVATFSAVSGTLMQRPLPPAVGGDELADRLDEILRGLAPRRRRLRRSGR